MRCSPLEVGLILFALTVTPIAASRLSNPARSSSRRSDVLNLLACAILLLVFVGLSLRCGALHIESRVVWDAFWSYDQTLPEHLVVRELRVPRTLIGLAAGSSLAVAGALTQGVTRNPLGAPGILGVNAGAAFAIVTAIHLLGVVSASGYIWFAFLGALGAAALVYGIASAGSGGPTPFKLAMAGAVITALLGSWTTTLLLFDQETLDQARFWLAGSVAGRDLDELTLIAPIIVLSLAGSILMGRHINTLNLGDDVARGLGQRVTLVRMSAGLLVVLLAGSAVAIAGPISFVGLAVPHMVRAVVGADYRRILPFSLVTGPCLLLGADVVGRVVVRPGELQVGIVTAAVGAPFLIYLVRFTKMTEL